MFLYIFYKTRSKQDVLKNLNEKHSSNSQNPLLHLDTNNNNKENINSNRKSWSKETDLSQLELKTLLVQTAQQNKYVLPVVSPRKAWDLPHQTILKAFELAEISPPSSTESHSGELKNEKLKRGETFVINRKANNNNSKSSQELKNTSSSSGSSNLLINEKEPSIFESLDALEATNKTHVDLVFSPEKLATLKATKNLLLGVTLGQFDPKNTKVFYI